MKIYVKQLYIMSELSELIETIKDEYKKEIEVTEYEIRKAKDKIHYLKGKLIDLGDVENHKETVKESLHEYCFNKSMKSFGTGNKYKQEFNKQLRKKVDTAIRQLENYDDNGELRKTY